MKQEQSDRKGPGHALPPGENIQDDEASRTSDRKSIERSSGWRSVLFFTIVLGITGVGAYLMADYLWAFGWTFSSGVLWVLFVVLFGYLAFGFTHAFTGFLVLRFGLPGGNMPLADHHSPGKDPTYVRNPRVAVVIPVYNEPVDRVFSGIRAIFDSVMKKRGADAFDFFILSDSNQPEQWVAEEAAWVKLCRECRAEDRIFYRRRPDNFAKKSGNISDFCRTWGDHYHYMIVLDADSIMTGDTLLELLYRMQTNLQVALIQTAPALVGGESLFGRMQQFANRLYGRMFMEGLAFWQECGGNFWGHNAIIRLRPFIEQCELPQLPGKKPFGGHILSHDFIEAGLLRKAGWEVWLAHDLDGSYEEGPQGIIESAQRDQRWCQGNLQHGMLLFARGLRGKTRIHLANGILGYVAAPLWLLFMIVAFWKGSQAEGGMPHFSVALNAQGLAILSITMVLLFAPKILCLLDLMFDSGRAAQFGGRFNAVIGAIVETVFSALIAPVMMLFHSRFVVSNIMGKTVGWATQRRGAQGTSWDEAIATHGWHTLIGFVVGFGALMVDPMLFWWLSPVLLGLWFSVPVSVWTSRSKYGIEALKEGLFMIPEEQEPPKEVAAALRASQMIDPKFHGMTSAVIDPFLNAVHVSLLRRNRRRLLNGRKVYGENALEKAPQVGTKNVQHALAERLLKNGPSSLNNAEALSVLSDIDNMLWLHREAWLRPSADLAQWWQVAIREKSAAV